MTHPPDEALRTLLRQGHPEAWPELYQRFAAAMFAVARSLTSSRSDAEDAVQQTFLDLYRARESLARAERLRAYAFRALHHAALRVQRKSRTFVAMDEVDPPADSNVEHLEHESDPKLAREMAALPFEHREVIALKIDGELTFAEIAAALGIPADTAASRYRRALEKLRERLGAEQ